MKILKSGLVVSLALLVLLTAATEIFSCFCREKSSVCNAYGDARAVFIGKVVEGKSIERMSDMLKAGTNDLTFSFKVSRGFIGATADQTIDVHTGFGFGDCGFPFEKGEEYIVYAYQYGDSKDLSTGICTRTTHISRAREDISGLEALFKTKGASVTGKVTRYERSSLLGEPWLPVARAGVKLVRSEDQKPFLAETNSQGQFIFAGLGPGKYRLVPPLDKGWRVRDYETQEFLLNEHGCAINNLSVINDTEIEVKVVDPDGQPVKNIWVELVPTTVPSSSKFLSVDEFTVTNPEGEARFFDAPPGTYTLSVNFFNMPDKEAPFPAVFAPGVEDRSRAQIIEIRPGTHLSETIVIKIPRALETVRLSGIVVDSSGKPIKGAQVNLLDETTPYICVNGCAETNEHGEFTLSGYRGRRYFVEAFLPSESDNRSNRERTGIFVLESDPNSLKIVVKRLK